MEMTAKHIMDSRARKAKKYIALHAELRREVESDRIQSSKRSRKAAKSAEHRAGMV